ncbi:MAG: hypothetical protein LC720_03515, partial [Actinobacteria bacterium]|nr:hypothetical protein [Actinomycetota bacterium]
RVNPADGAVSIVSVLPLPDGAAALSSPAFDAQGRLWVAWVASGSPTLTVARIAAGAAQQTYQAAAPAYAQANGEIQFRASGMWVRMGDKAYRLSGAALLATPHGVPVFEEGSLVIADAISLDGGQSFYDTVAGALAVEGDPALLAAGNRIMRRYSPALFSGMAEGWADTFPPVNRAVSTGDGIVVVDDGWRSPRVSSGYRMLWHAGAPSDPPFSTGPMSTTFTGWLHESNALRAQAGLPPLIGDPAISPRPRTTRATGR